MRRPLLSVSVVVDTSGSMEDAQLRAALSEIKGVIKAAGIGSQRLLVLACDAAVGAARRVRRVEDVQLVGGGGGTDLRVGIATADTSRPRPDVVVVLTDGYTPWPECPTRARLVVAIIGEPSAARTVPDWATTVVVAGHD
jgi:predicted metal-dependent peptidase